MRRPPSGARVPHSRLAMLYVVPLALYLTVFGGWGQEAVIYLVVGAGVLGAPGPLWRTPRIYRSVMGLLALGLTAITIIAFASLIGIPAGLMLLPTVVCTWRYTGRPATKS